jgi:hypothetical protein
MSMRVPDRKKGDAKLRRYFPMGNEVAKSACKRIINVIVAVPIKTNELYTTVDIYYF